VNKKLNTANVEIEKANTNILVRNKEIEEQKNELEISHKKIIHSVNYAKRIQSAMLPTSDLFNEYFEEHFIFYRPKDIVSGDFYWAKKLDDILYFAVADCTGHGVPGAFVSVLGISLLNEIVAKNRDYNTAQILDELRTSIKTSLKQKDIKSDSKEGMDIALCTINLKTNEMQFAGAYNPLYIIRRDELVEIKADRQPIAIHRKEKEFTNHIVRLQKEDLVYLFSDGFIDQFGGDSKEKFKTKRFKNLIIENSNKTLLEQYQIIEQTFDNWKTDAKQIDDVAILAVKIK
jgi:serine phosphatase RsbU (regulator of sigma subunit)